MIGLRRMLLANLRPSVIILQWVGNLLIFALVSAWLQIPDSHAWQFVISMLTGAVIVIAFCWLQVATFARVHREAACGHLWARMIGFAVLAAIWFLGEQWMSSRSNHLWLYAAYWNSRLLAGQRVIFTPVRLVIWTTALVALAEWIALGFLLPLAIEVSTAGLRRVSVRCFVRPWRKLLYWLAVIIACLVATQLTGALVSWIPGKGVGGQIASVTARLGIVYTADILLWCTLLALTGAWMESARVAANEVDPVR